MASLEVKRDPWVIVPYTLFVLGGILAYILKDPNTHAPYLSLGQLLALFGALNVASVFGLRKLGGDDAATPTAPPAPPLLGERRPDQDRIPTPRDTFQPLARESTNLRVDDGKERR